MAKSLQRVVMNTNMFGGASLPVDNDLKALYGSVKALKQNLWDAHEPLCFDGISWSNSVREGAAVLLLNALKLNWTVRTLVLRNTVLDLKASKALAEVFGRSCPLQSISLSKLHFHSQSNGMPTLLFDIMFLQELSLDECTLRAESCVALGRMLKRSKEIRSLTLQNLSLDSSAWITGLMCSTSLTNLSLENMQLHPNRIEKLLSVLTDSTTLTNVKLDDMNIGERHAMSLGLVLSKNSHLKVLSLQANNLMGSSMKWILSLVENTTLQYLDLSNNPLGDDGANLLVCALQQNRSLDTLLVVKCEITRYGCDYIARSIATFRGLKYLSADENAMEECGALLEASLMYENTTLCRIFNNPPSLDSSPPLDAASLCIWKSVDFYLRLNKAHRGCFTMVNAPVVSDLLPNLLERAAKQSDILYYCLRIILPAMANEGS